MKITMSLLIAICLATSSYSQITINTQLGISKHKLVTPIVELGYDFKHFNVAVGHATSFTDIVTISDIVYLKAGRMLWLTDSSGIDVNIGYGLHYYSVERVKGIYSHYDRIFVGRPVVTVGYSVKLISHGWFVVQFTNSWKEYYLSVGLKFKG